MKNCFSTNEIIRSLDTPFFILFLFSSYFKKNKKEYIGNLCTIFCRYIVYNLILFEKNDYLMWEFDNLKTVKVT